jgi:hypothetical protein
VSQPDSESTRPAGILVRKPKASIYVAMLGIALVAIVIGCIVLHLELAEYGGFMGFFSFPWNVRI